MAKFSEQFIASLTQPAFSQSMLNLGTAIGGVPGNIKEKRREDQLAKIMRAANLALSTGNANGIASVRQQLEAAGFSKEAAKLIEPERRARAAEARGGMLSSIFSRQFDPTTLTPETLKNLSSQDLAAALTLDSSLRERTNRADLRSNLKTRADALGGPFANLAIDMANDTQLESIRTQIAAEELKRQQETEKSSKLTSAIESLLGTEQAAGIDIPTVFGTDPDVLEGVARDLAAGKTASILKNREGSETRKTLMRIAQARSAPQSVIDDIDSGMYDQDFNAGSKAISGSNAVLKNYRDTRTGEIKMYPTLGGKVLINNNYVFPTQQNLVEVTSVTADAGTVGFKNRSKSLPSLTSAAGVTDRFIDDLDNLADLKSKLVDPLRLANLDTDKTASLTAFNLQVTNAITRFESGAAIKDDELPRYQKMFGLGFTDIGKKEALAQKIIGAAAMIALSADYEAGLVRPEVIRSRLSELASLQLSKEDSELIKSGKPGSLKKVIKKYTDTVFSQVTENSALEQQANDIMMRLNQTSPPLR